MKATERAWPMVAIVCATVVSWHALDLLATKAPEVAVPAPKGDWERYGIHQPACKTVFLENTETCIPPGRYPHMAASWLEHAQVMTDVTVDGDTVIVGAPR